MKDYLKLRELAYDFRGRIEEVQRLYFDALYGFDALHAQILKDRSSIRIQVNNPSLLTDELLDRSITNYQYFGSEGPVAIPGIPGSTQREALDRTQRNGGNSFTLAAQCIVVFAYWEHFLRQEIASARGCKKADVLSPLWGDLAKIRNSLVHSRDRKASKDVGKCCEITWFKPGEKIDITLEQMREIFRKLLLEHQALELESMPATTGRINFATD